MKRSTLYLLLGILLGVAGIVLSVELFFGLGMSDGRKNLEAAIFMSVLSVALSVFGLVVLLRLHVHEKEVEANSEEIKRIMEQERQEIAQRNNEENHA